jgi:tRNA dimethylallyltransferase
VPNIITLKTSINKMKNNLIVILGPTASGKTKLAARLTKELGGEIISADSRQVYRGMDMGTGKDLSDYLVEGTMVPHHLMDIVEPDYEFNVFDYQRLFLQCFSEITAKGLLPVLVGGTGLYIDAVLKGYRMLPVPENDDLRAEMEDKETDVLIKRLISLNPNPHNTTDITDRRRLIRAIEIAAHSKEHGRRDDRAFPPLNPLVIGLRWERSLLRMRITSRLEERLAAGMIGEVTTLHDKGIDWDRLDSFGLEYRYIGSYLQDKLTYQEMFRQLNTKIHQFAKRQETWFRRMERQGTIIHWLENPDYEKLKKLVERVRNL